MAKQTTKFYVDAQGNYLGGFAGSVPDGGIEINSPPQHASQIWSGSSWGPISNPTTISFDDFEARFTTAEWDDATDFVYQVDTTTGNPKRKALIQGLARAQARNSVDLLDAKTETFLSVLVNGEIITASRKTAILTP